MRTQLAMLGLSIGIVAVGCVGTNKVVPPSETSTSTPVIIGQTGHGLDARFVRDSAAQFSKRTVKTWAHVEPAPVPPMMAPAPVPPQPVQPVETRKVIMVPFKSGSARLTAAQVQAIDVQ